jgi:tetratricopeptide (TPR) repeat protein
MNWVFVCVLGVMLAVLIAGCSRKSNARTGRVDDGPSNEKSKAELNERISQFRRMANDDPENELAHFRLGQFLMEDSQFAEAIKSFERAIALAPEFARCYLLLGECLIKVGKKERAKVVLNKGCEAADKRDDPLCRRQIEELLKKLNQ